MARAAKRLKVVPETIYRWTREGLLRAYKVGGESAKVLIAQAEIDALLEGRKYTPPTESAPSWEAPSYPLAKG